MSLIENEKDKESVISKINKLLRLGTSSNENEASAAMAKARKLMLEYHLEENDLEEKDSCKVVTNTFDAKGRWENILFSEIARNMRCECYMTIRRKLTKTNSGVKFKPHYTISVVGFEVDAKAVEIMGKSYIETCERVMRDERKRIRESDYYCDTKGLKEMVSKGFIYGLRQAFEEQNREDSKYALLVITPKEVKEEMNKIHCKTQNSGRLPDVNSQVASAFKAGYDSGYRSGQKRQLEC